LLGATPKEAIEAAGDKNVPLVKADGGKGGENAVEMRVFEQIDRALRVSWEVLQPIESL